MERHLALNIDCKTIPIESLNTSTRSAMWTLFSDYYSGLEADSFEADLMAKDQAILLSRDNQLVGFTSLGSCKVDTHRIVYSGDVIIAPSARDIGTAHFFHQWACAVWENYDWWCLLTSGPRTFRIAHTFYKRVTPCEPETDAERQLRHRFAASIYGDQYDTDSNIVRLKHPYLIKQSAPTERSDYPLAKTFRQLNPGWQKGDELVSLIRLHPDNWKPLAMRMLKWQKKDG